MVTVQHVKMAAQTQADVVGLSPESSAHASDDLHVYLSSSVGTRLVDSSRRITRALRLTARFANLISACAVQTGPN